MARWPIIVITITTVTTITLILGPMPSPCHFRSIARGGQKAALRMADPQGDYIAALGERWEAQSHVISTVPQT